MKITLPAILKFTTALFSGFLFIQPLAHAQTIGPDRVLIRNVTLFDPAGSGEDKVVNIMIRDNKLDLVTEDSISRDEADMVVNANGGSIMGKLDLGSPPNFMIFNEDPRENFEVLMDTFTYSVLVVHDGVVIKNRLYGVVAEEEEDEPQKASWLAYTPPPMMVPVGYGDTDKWNRFNSKWVNGIFVAGFIMDRQRWFSQNSDSEMQVGDLSGVQGGEIRGFRIGAVGTVNFDKPWIWTIFGATNAYDKGFETNELDSFTLFDWRMDIPFFNNSVMSIGKQKEPISGERVQSMLYNSMQERSSVSDALLPSRNVGIVWNGSSPEKYSSWGFGVFNDWFDANQDIDESATQYAGRLAWAPLVSEDESNLMHLGVGYRHSNAKEGFRYSTEPEFNNAPDFVNTSFGVDVGVLPAEKLDTYNLELGWRKGPLWLASEYTRTKVDSPALGNPVFDGYWVSATYSLTGEMRKYNKKSGTFGGQPVSRSVYQNGKGAWQVSFRYSDLDLTDGLVNGGDMQIASVGVGWWLTPFFGVDLNYRYIWNEINGLKGETTGWNSRLVLMLE
jgi:phosphate-selective porin OprO/OprP